MWSHSTEILGHPRDFLECPTQLLAHSRSHTLHRSPQGIVLGYPQDFLGCPTYSATCTQFVVVYSSEVLGRLPPSSIDHAFYIDVSVIYVSFRTVRRKHPGFHFHFCVHQIPHVGGVLLVYECLPNGLCVSFCIYCSEIQGTLF